MKNKLTYILLALLTLAPLTASARQLYLKPNSNWTQSNAWFAAYFFDNGEKWVKMTAVSGQSGVYEVTVPTDKTYPKVIFCRMNPAKTALSWDSKWNQTGDLTIPAEPNNCFTMASSSWDGATTTWGHFEVAVTSVTLNKSSVTLTKGTVETLTATIAPTHATYKDITWSSSATGVATVVNGKITAVAAGTATITAKSHNNKTATCTVTVKEPAPETVLVSGITVSPATLTLTKGGATSTLTATVLPTNATDKTYTWSSSNTAVATVNASGVVTPVAVGTANIKATAKDGSGKEGVCVVTVKDKLYSFTINFYTTWTNPKLYWWDSPTQTGDNWPGNAIPSLRTSKGEGWWEVHFTDIEESAQFILNDGTGGDKKQTADLTVAANHTSGDYYMNSSGQLAAFVHVTGVTLNKTTLTLKKNATETLSTTFAPTNATVKDVTWESSDTKVATVASNGKVTAVAPGTATITVTTKNNGKTATCTVTVPSTEVTISKTSLSMVNGTTATLTATANGPGATINWTSSNQTVATISSTGVITAKAVGSTTITATASDNNTVKATCTVTVTAASVLSTIVTITNAPTVMRINEVLTLTATTNGTNQNVTWSTSNANVIAVAGGTLTAKAAGTATITATAADGSGKKATCTIAVYPSVTLYVNTSEVGWGDETNIYYIIDGKIASGFAKPIPAPAHALTTGWYEFDLPISDKGVTFIVRKSDSFLDGSNYPKQYQTNDIVVTAAEVAAAKEKGLARTVLLKYDGSMRSCTPSDEHTTTRAFIYSTDGVKDYYSNRLTADGTFSYYVATTHTAFGLYTGNDILGYTKKQALSVTQSNVYTQTYTAATKTAGAPALYTGDYYINSAATAAGKWTDFSTLTDAKKTELAFTQYTAEDNTELYYWVKWIDYNKNVNGSVGNPYNPYLSEVVSDDWVNASGTMPKNGSVRYQYNPATNELQRTMLDGSTENTGFLKVYSSANSDKILSVDTKTAIPYANAIVFSDASDWVYEATVWAKDNATATVTAKFNGREYCLFGYDADDNVIEKVLRDNDGEEGTMLMRIIYDYKTNRMMAAWQMKDDQIDGTKMVNSNVLITRQMNEPATQVTFKDNASKMVVHGKIYTQLEILKTEYKENGSFLWISLPYDCYLKDVYGIEGYGTKWTIQRYRGDKRAAETWNKDSSPFWRDMNNKSATAKLEAGRGYVVHLNLQDGDFTDFSIMNKDSTFTITSALRLYFPSAGDSHTFANAATYDVPVHECTIEPRTDDDSNWNVMGVTGLHDMVREAGDDAIAGYFTWAWDATNKRGVYTAKPVTEETIFASTKAYMVQYAGTINWQQSASAQSVSLAPRRTPEVAKAYNLQVDFTDGKYPVRTFINMNEQGTAAYDLNRDMGMIINEGMPQIYSLTGASQLAINNLPVESQSVALGIQSPAAGEYTFSMADVPAGIIPTLYDSKTGATINLAFDKYTVALEAGTFEKRFVLQINVQKTPTGCEDLTAHDAYRITQVGNSLLISGLTEPADVRLYDALGRVLYEGSVQYEAIPVTQTGVYLVSINGEVQRVLIR